MKETKTDKEIRFKIVREVAIKGRRHKDVAEEFNIDPSYVYRIICIHNLSHLNVIPISMGEKREPYWLNEMDYWIGQHHHDNPFGHLKYKDVYKEEEPIERLKVSILDL